MDTNANLEPGQMAQALRALVPASIAGPGPGRVALDAFLGTANPIDVAYALQDLEAEEATHVFDRLAQDARGVVLAEADPRTQAALLMHVGDRGTAELVSSLPPDDAADVLDAVEAPAREQILENLGKEDAAEIRELRRFEPETAGGLMTTDYVAVSPSASAGDVIRRIREQPEAETVNVIYVTDAHRLVGVLSLRQVLVAARGRLMGDVMTREVITIAPEEPQEEVIRRMETYHLGAIPVVDTEGALLGIVTSDDVLTAQEAEASKDVMALSGSSGAFPTRMRVIERVRARIPWLFVTLGGGMGASYIIQAVGRWLGHEEAVGQLGRFLPVVAGMAGNVAMQSAAVMVRGFATGEIHPSRVPRIIVEEILVGAIVGVLCGGVAAVIAHTTGIPWDLSTAIGLSIACATTLAGCSGTVIPAVCVRWKIDPAISAGPFITTLNDLLGFTIYMAVALSMIRVST